MHIPSNMHIFFIVTITALSMQVLKGDAVNGAMVRIHPVGQTISATLGTDVTLSCSVHGQVDSNGHLRWEFKNGVLKVCNLRTTDDTSSDVHPQSCNLTISPQVSSRGVYRCYVFGESNHDHRRVELKLVVPYTTNDLLDLSTGDTHGRLCVQPDTTRSFECIIRDTKPSAWNITWILGDKEGERGSIKETISRDGLIDVSSRFTVFNTEKDGHVSNLTCRAEDLENQHISVTAQLQFCSENSSVLKAVVISVSSTLLTVAVIALIILAVRFKCRASSGTLQEIQHAESTVATNALSHRERTELKVVRKYEDKIKPREERKYEDRITPQVEREYDDRITPDEAALTTSGDDSLPSWAAEWEIYWRDLQVDDRVLGRGNFGEVRSGTVRRGEKVTRAAVKMLKGHASASDRADFLDELRTMATIGYHPNIVFLLAACHHQDVLYVALEYLPRGDLRSYLRTVRSQSDSDEAALSSDQLVKFALDVAKGMEHLAQAGVIHRDLAARNILLGEGLVAKVSDFGLSRGEDIYVQTSKRRVPIRWLAIESVTYKKYTTKSDVWSFGVLLWEVVTVGGTPYPSMKSESLAAQLKRGYRMTKPNNCNEQCYDLMRECWEEDPNNRPTFTDLVSILSDMADNRIKHTYMSMDRVHFEDLSFIGPELDEN